MINFILPASLWSDLHQPESSEHIIGNTKSVKQLKKWLEEWKVVVDKQARKANRAAKTTSKSKGKGQNEIFFYYQAGFFYVLLTVVWSFY